ncbi:hypothetical protein [Roseobacter sp. S98]|uniref:hypothetical protein n=1 Tax=Roseobacter algicola (ex Choi et al. 2025) (nom. illeg.) TaxID=3092138 RepID=UPI003F5150F3
MKLLDPETFADQPYVAGLNQTFHMIAGAALFAFLWFLMSPLWAVALSFVIFTNIEIWQLNDRGAVLWDTVVDLLFWSAGTIAWCLATARYDLPPAILLTPVWLIMICGLVIAVYAAFNRLLKEL